MLRSVGRVSSSFPALTATVNAVPSGVSPVIAPVLVKSSDVVLQPSQEILTNQALARSVPKGCLSVSTGLGRSTQVRFAHSDISVPDFSEYRRPSVKNTGAKSEATQVSRKSFTYLTMIGSGLGLAYGGKSVVQEFIGSLSASADVLALAKIEINMEDVPEGKSAVFKWRGKPLFVRHRPSDEIEEVRAVDIAQLRDPERDEDRVKDDKWLILLGVCTHLGCVPIANAGEYGGYYCPCHGSHYDASGRIRKGPAPLNLEVPEHSFPGNGVLVVG
ncbi:unnamed protein product [Owenia fusiformis]|uniref:Cytochrome b-c1 complex subunit Rieske, mitochondrial n=1 Tax=Owenia fusiformis TaxID=6347 RepID=A0A8J1UQI8_OWEFU|nr:unnamed protein product [Owenia fusiformis]